MAAASVSSDVVMRSVCSDVAIVSRGTARSSSTVGAGSSSATSAATRIAVSGARSSWEALATKRRCVAIAPASGASTWPETSQPPRAASTTTATMARAYCDARPEFPNHGLEPRARSGALKPGGTWAHGAIRSRLLDPLALLRTIVALTWCHYGVILTPWI